MLLVRDIRLPLAAGEQEAVAAALKKTGLPRHGIKNTGIAKLSVDARHGRPSLVYTVALELADEGAERSFERFAPYVSIAAPAAFTVHNGTRPLAHSPVVCGFGPAGLFAALLLARQGFRPIVLERGPAMEQRAQAVERFNAAGLLDENANIQFGEGGAGTFSDGKLTTRINDPLCAFVTRTLLAHGAPRDIAYKQKPHIGTDALRDVIVSIRREVEALGGKVLFNTPLTGLHVRDGRRASCPAVRCCSRRGTRPGIHLKCWTARVLLCRQSLFRWAFGPSTCSAALKKAFTTMRRAIRLCRGVSTSFPSMWADGAFTPSVCVRAAAWWRPPAKRAAQ